jgi:hypothetical protein
MAEYMEYLLASIPKAISLRRYTGKTHDCGMVPGALQPFAGEGKYIPISQLRQLVIVDRHSESAL